MFVVRAISQINSGQTLSPCSFKCILFISNLTQSKRNQYGIPDFSYVTRPLVGVRMLANHQRALSSQFILSFGHCSWESVLKESRNKLICLHESAHYVCRFDSRPAMLNNRIVQHVNSELAIHVQRNVTLIVWRRTEAGWWRGLGTSIDPTLYRAHL